MEKSNEQAETKPCTIHGVSRSFLSEDDLVELGFEKRLMLGTGYVSISSMRPAQYYYKKRKDNDKRNSILDLVLRWGAKK